MSNRWSRMADWTDEEWEEYLASLWADGDTVIENVRKEIVAVNPDLKTED